jgi:hypothetical protein
MTNYQNFLISKSIEYKIISLNYNKYNFFRNILMKNIIFQKNIQQYFFRYILIFFKKIKNRQILIYIYINKSYIYIFWKIFAKNILINENLNLIL